MTSHQQAMIPIEDISDVFQDLTPIPQTDGPDRVCVIQYPTAFSIAYNYMRAVWATKELSGTQVVPLLPPVSCTFNDHCFAMSLLMTLNFLLMECGKPFVLSLFVVVQCCLFSRARIEAFCHLPKTEPSKLHGLALPSPMLEISRPLLEQGAGKE
jgi:hypothetical protein